MASLNRVLLMGNLTRDIEVKYTANNTAVANIGLAVNRRYRSGDEYREETTFVDCEAWGRTAETMGKYLSKGRPVFIEGRLKLDEWQDKDGNRRTKLVTVVENFQFIDSRQGGGGSGGGGQQAPAAAPSGGVTNDDIPF
ncbi:MAG: single-stranded DNA-binding protein [Phycisphaerales bacterium]|nr:single-stranded DNA-binding protein [Phycisphaerales bacterium]